MRTAAAAAMRQMRVRTRSNRSDNAARDASKRASERPSGGQKSCSLAASKKFCLTLTRKRERERERERERKPRRELNATLADSRHPIKRAGARVCDSKLGEQDEIKLRRFQPAAYLSIDVPSNF